MQAGLLVSPSWTSVRETSSFSFSSSRVLWADLSRATTIGTSSRPGRAGQRIRQMFELFSDIFCLPRQRSDADGPSRKDDHRPHSNRNGCPFKTGFFPAPCVRIMHGRDVVAEDAGKTRPFKACDADGNRAGPRGVTGFSNGRHSARDHSLSQDGSSSRRRKA